MRMMLRWVLLAAAFMGATCTAAQSQEYFLTTRDWDNVEGWRIAYNADRNGCFAYAEYSGGYRIWFGYQSRKLNAFLAVSNENWKDVRKGAEYKVRYVFDGRRSWNGNGKGYTLKASEGVEVGDINERFMLDFAGSGRVEYEILGRKGRLSLRGTSAALREAYRCADRLALDNPPKPASPAVPQVSAQPPATPEAPPKRSQVSTGTGFFISDKGHLLTNAHVVEGCTEATLRQRDGASAPAQILARSKLNDLAILKTAAKPLAVAGFRSGASVRLGDDVVVFGFPLAGQLTVTGNLTTGLVSALAGFDEDISKMQITAPVQSGNSGGPVLDRAGNVVGVVVSKTGLRERASGPVEVLQNINFAIKSNIATLFLDANSVAFDAIASDANLSVADVAEKARGFTVLLTCESR